MSLYVLTGFVARNYQWFIVAGITAYAGTLYLNNKGLEDTLKIERANNAKLEQSIEQQNAAIEHWVAVAENLQIEVFEADAVAREAERERDAVITDVKNNEDILKALSESDPPAAAKVVQDGMSAVLNGLRGVDQ